MRHEKGTLMARTYPVPIVPKCAPSPGITVDHSLTSQYLGSRKQNRDVTKLKMAHDFESAGAKKLYLVYYIRYLWLDAQNAGDPRMKV